MKYTAEMPLEISLKQIKYGKPFVPFFIAKLIFYKYNSTARLPWNSGGRRVFLAEEPNFDKKAEDSTITKQRSAVKYLCSLANYLMIYLVQETCLSYRFLN